MSHEYTYFKMALESIDQGCPSLLDYETFIPHSYTGDYCSHFKNEAEFIGKAEDWLDALINTKVTDSMLAGVHAVVAANTKRMSEEAALVDRADFIALLSEDWAARHLGCEA